MRTYNRSTIVGRVGNDVIVRFTQAGKPVVNLRVATDIKKKDGSQITTWHRAVLWDRLAEIAGRYLNKGELVLLEGALFNKEYTDKEGIVRHTLEMTARDMMLLGGRPQAAAEPARRVVHAGQQTPRGEEIAEVVEDIPF